MSGYRLYKSPSLQSFPDTYPNMFLGGDPLAKPVYVIVQNAGLGEWLGRFLTRKMGGVMGLRLLMPEQALRLFAAGFPEACNRMGGTEKLLFLDGMKLTLYKALEEIGTEDEVFAAVKGYLQADPENRLWQLACAAAPIFHHYGMNCCPLTDSWETDTPYPGLGATDRAHEAWQRRLWRRVFNGQAPYSHLSRVLLEISGTDEPYTGEEARIVLFGSTFLGERGLAFFRKLADYLDVHHFTLTPCALSETPSQYFLLNNARLSAGFNSLIPALKPDAVEENQENPGSGETTLRRLRASLIHNQEFSPPPENDGSLLIHDSPGIRRTIEILKDEILAALAQNPELAPTQIGVLAPDISLYAPYMEIIFPAKENNLGADSLPYNITDLPNRDEAPYPAAFNALLKLPGSRFGRGELLPLLENPCFAPADPARARQWKTLIDELNIRWGADEKHRRTSGAADTSTGSWAQGFRRILAGYYHDEEDSRTILPKAELPDTLAEDAGVLIQAVRELHETIWPLQGKTMSLREWTALWEKLIAIWLTPRREDPFSAEDENHRLRIKKALRDLNALSEDVNHLEDFANPRLPWPVFRALLDEIRAGETGRRGRYLARGITCASLKPTRAIPFRRIYVLGLDENIWPGRDALTSFDLREKIPRAIDISRASVDRFALLEVIFSAADHLSLFYTGRDAERGEALAPAAPVRELLEHLGEGAEKLMRQHPLAPRGTAAPCPSPAPETRPVPCGREEGEGDMETVDWEELAHFLRNPVRHFYARRIGARLSEEESDPEDCDILEAEYLRWHRQQAEAVRENITALENPENFIAALTRRCHLESAVSNTPLAAMQAEGWLEDAQSLAAQLERIRGEGFNPQSTFSCRLGGRNEDAASEKMRTLPLLHAAPDGMPPLAVRGIVSGLGFLNEDGTPNRQIWTLTDFISRKTPNAASALRSWTAVLVLAAALDEELPDEIRVFRLGGRDFKARRYYFSETRPPAGSGGEKILIAKPRLLLEKLVWAFRKGEESPLPLYPELADALAKDAAAADDFPLAARTAWNAILSNTFTLYSALRDCKWRRHFLPEPMLENTLLPQMYEAIYKAGGIL
ncbi:MAG: hypothetical protein B0D92_08700 [Spirochaeta sp. LUC14_002_19_P3]|nr:MAG: hypothetical protein B0D92_08700 [Spirochaeta sp. LUC14_002_19_P3]